MSDHSLVLQSVTRLLAGDYTCLAANSESKSTSNPVSLRVRCKRSASSMQSSQIGPTNAYITLQMHQFVRLTARSCSGLWNMKRFSWSAKLMPHHRPSRSIGHSTHPANRLIYHPNCIRVRWVYKREKKPSSSVIPQPRHLIINSFSDRTLSPQLHTNIGSRLWNAVMLGTQCDWGSEVTLYIPGCGRR